MSGAAGPLAAESAPRPLTGTIAGCASLAGLPLLVALVYTNASDVAMRSLGFPSLLQPLVALLAAAAILARRELGSRAILQPLTFALAGWVAVVALSTIWARDLPLADDRAAETLKGFVSYLIVVSLASSWRSLRLALASLAASAAVLSLLTFAQVAAGSEEAFLGFARGQMSNLYGDVAQLRTSGPVGDPNFYAQILLFAIPLAVFTGFSSRRPLARAACFAAGLVTFGGLLTTYSRGGMVAVLVMASLSLAAVRIKARQALLAAAVAAGIALTLLALPLETARRLRTVESLLSEPSVEQDSSILKRKLLLSSAWRMFEEHPLVGVGAGNFARQFTSVRNEIGFAPTLYEERGDRHYPHNLYFEIAAENGLLGIAAFALAVVTAFAGLRRARLRLDARGSAAEAALVAGISIAIAGYLVSSLFLHGAFQRYLWMLFGFAAAAVRLAPRRVAPAAEAK